MGIICAINPITEYKELNDMICNNKCTCYKYEKSKVNYWVKLSQESYDVLPQDLKDNQSIIYEI
jgi:hypothetical protein